MGILGPFPQALDRHKFLLVIIDYFTKRMETESLGCIIEAKIKNFIWKSIIYRFDLSMLIIDNGYQFSGTQFVKFCQELGMAYIFSH